MRFACRSAACRARWGRELEGLPPTGCGDRGTGRGLRDSGGGQCAAVERKSKRGSRKYGGRTGPRRFHGTEPATRAGHPLCAWRLPLSSGPSFLPPSPPNKRQLNPGLSPSRSTTGLQSGGERVGGRSGGKGSGQSPPRGAPWVDVPHAQAGRPRAPGGSLSAGLRVNLSRGEGWKESS